MPRMPVCVVSKMFLSVIAWNALKSFASTGFIGTGSLAAGVADAACFAATDLSNAGRFVGGCFEVLLIYARLVPPPASGLGMADAITHPAAATPASVKMICRFRFMVVSVLPAAVR